jgi:pumilio family protein 6
MPTATTTKSAMAGIKRKSAPVKNAHVKESKKPKFDPGMKSVLKTKTQSVPVKKVEEAVDEESEDSDSDGGVSLNFESGESEDVDSVDSEEQEEEENDSEKLPTSKDGLHPQRAKAVVTNSKISYSLRGYHTNKPQASLRRKLMLNRNNWHKREKLPNLWRTNWSGRRRFGNAYVENHMSQLMRGNNW